MSDAELLAVLVVSVGVAGGSVGALVTLAAIGAARARRLRAEQREIDRRFAAIVRGWDGR